MLSVALALLLPLAPQGAAPDRSTPEKTIAGFLEWKEGMQVRNLAAFKTMLGFEVLGAEHFSGKAGARLEMQKKRGERVATDAATPEISTKITDRSDGKDRQTLEVEVRLQRSPEQKRSSKRIMRFEVQKHDGVWLIEKIERGCWSCGGKGTCPKCSGAEASKRECRSCKQTGRCRACDGKGFRSDESHLPRVKLALPSTEPKFSNEWTTPESAAQAYADLMLRRRYEQSKLMKQIVDREIALLAQWVSPRLMKECHENIADSVRAQEQRYNTERLTVLKVQKKGDKATATLERAKGHRWPGVSEVTLERVDGAWKVVEVRTQNRASKSKPPRGR